MAVRPIRIFPDSVLSAPCRPVTSFGAELQSLINDLRETMLASPGVGIAAPQIGITLRVSVIDVGRTLKKRSIDSTYHGSLIVVNPRLVKAGGTQTPREGCLSVPDLLANVRRHEEVEVAFVDEEGRHRTVAARGFEALALQHELDHLDGLLFLDRVSNLKTDLFRRKGSG
ncbi:MAG: peptide deformylase [Elusimicrobia bacterium]|nr:peptide deformylase [Elusimicrobiota bacterium]